MDIHALKRQGMTIGEIARRTDHDRKTIRAYLAGQRTPGERKRADPDPFEVFLDYVTARLTEDPHLWAATLLDELVPLGFEGSYQTLTRQIRDRGLRPACTACAHVTKRPNAMIEHPPGEETQFDWVELPDAPAGWAFPTKRAFVLVGSLAYPGVWRAVISPSMDLPHLLAAMTMNRAYNRHPERFTRRPQPPQIRTEVWIVSGHEKLPIGGHGTAHWWPAELPTGGHEICPLQFLIPARA